MVIKANVFKIFLICSNILLLCVGLTVFILGVKMHLALSLLSLISIPLVQNAVNAVIAAGVFICFCSLSGFLGSCNESKGLMMGHLIFLGIIVILEFSIGVTLMMVKKSVSAAVGSSDCNNVCTATFDAAILDYALPSAGLMMSVIFVEALMIYSSIRLYFFIRDMPRVTGEQETSIVGLNVQMQNVAGTPVAFASQSQTSVTSQTELEASQPQMSRLYQVPFRRSQSNIEERPPDYQSLFNNPPQYSSERRYAVASTSTMAELPKETDDSLNPV